MRQTLFSFPLPLFLFLFSTSAFLAIIAANDLIHRTCKKCAERDPNLSYSFCVKSLEEAPESHSAEDLLQLGMITINLLHRNLTNSRSCIQELLNNKKSDPFAWSCLHDCFDLYSDAVNSIQQAKQDFKRLHFGRANIDVSSVMDASTTCEDGFKEREGVVSPLTKRNKITFQLSAISLSIINILHRHAFFKY